MHLQRPRRGGARFLWSLQVALWLPRLVRGPWFLYAVRLRRRPLCGRRPPSCRPSLVDQLPPWCGPLWGRRGPSPVHPLRHRCRQLCVSRSPSLVHPLPHQCRPSLIVPLPRYLHGRHAASQVHGHLPLSALCAPRCLWTRHRGSTQLRLRRPLCGQALWRWRQRGLRPHWGRTYGMRCVPRVCVCTRLLPLRRLATSAFVLRSPARRRHRRVLVGHRRLRSRRQGLCISRHGPHRRPRRQPLPRHRQPLPRHRYPHRPQPRRGPGHDLRCPHVPLRQSARARGPTTSR